VFAGLFTHDKIGEADAARRIGRTMTLAVKLHDLRTVMQAESTSAAKEFFAALYGFTLAEIDEILGEELTLPTDEARKNTDRQFAAVRPDPATRPSLEALRAELVAARVTTDRGLETAEASVESGWEIYVAFAHLERSASNVNRDLIARVATGHYGAGSSRLLTTVAQLQTVAATVEVSNRQGILMQGMYSAVTDADKAAVVADLRDTSVSWRRLSADLPPNLSPAVRASWEATIGGPDIEALDRFLDNMVIDDVVRPSDADPVSATSPESKAAAHAVIVRAKGLGDLIHEAGAEGLAVAQADAASAERRGQLAFGGTVALLLFTAALLALIGGSLRSRLRDLAAAAERFSAGRLEEMSVHGPQEIAVAADALNDAVASFRRVAVQAERLSAGDLDAVELQQAAPGALGSAVHASVLQIVSAAREREKLKQELAHQASHDDLTRLPNRAETERLLTGALGRAQRGGFRVAVLFIDLDHFKECNDTLGHAAGDQVLRTSATRMTDAVRPGDTVCRLGGDEFVVVIEPVGNDRSVVEIAERIVTALARPIDIGGTAVTISGSIGMAMSEPTSDADSLIREADSAMYLAKATSRGSIEIFDETLRNELHQEAAFKEAMAYAVDHDELELHYQPVIGIATGAVTGFEALARWQRPGHGMVSPDQFIPQAEATGLITDIGVWALRRATTQLMAWSAADPMYDSMQVAVNLSGRHLAEARVVDDVRAALDRSGLEPGRLIVEITESVAIDSPATVRHLTLLADLGVQIALDDFGTGYTSIAQLLHLPVHILKIDRSLVSGTNEDGGPALGESTRVVDLIIEIAHSLDLHVIAEGVEETFQLDKLTDANCETAQGYLISRPLPPDQIPTWMRARRRGTESLATPSI
jgi:diguanylate cyclase (GGDEF)-like protein